jgi:outer membrane protein assembly factor BamE
MKKIFSLLLMALLFSSCSIFMPHKQDVEQGNVFTEDEVARIHTGMSQEGVRSILGDPVSITTFSDNRLNYVYSFQSGYKYIQIKRLILTFSGGRLSNIQRN